MSNPYFTNNVPAVGAPQGGTRIVRGASQRITRAVPGSQGKNIQVEEIDYTDRYTQAENWVEDLSYERGGPTTGYGRWEKVNEGLEDQRRFPVDHMLGSLSNVEEKQILASEGRIRDNTVEARVTIDPVTRIPDNVAEQDPRAESDAFFGSDKYPRQLDNVMKRYDEVDRPQEKVDYPSSTAIPIRVIRRKPRGVS